MNKGFTLIETLIAVTIITLAIAGPIYSAERSLIAAYAARDQLVASYLAQEAVEYIRWMRDDAYLGHYTTCGANCSSVSTQAWNDFIGGSSPGISACRNAGGTSYACTLDPTQPMGSAINGTKALNKCTSPTNCPPLYLQSNGIYSEVVSGNTQTAFTRSVSFCDIKNTKPGVCNPSPGGLPDEETLTVKVAWSTNRIPFTVTVTDRLLPWE